MYSPSCLWCPDSLQRLSTVLGVWEIQVACLGYICGTQITVDQAWNQKKEVSLPARINTAIGSHQSKRPINQWFSNFKMQRNYLRSLLKFMHNTSCNEEGESVFLMFYSWQLLELCPFPAFSTFGQLSIENPHMPCVPWYRREVWIFQTPNSCFKLPPLHSTATLRAESTLSTWFLFSFRPNLRPSPSRIFLLFTMWIIYFLSYPFVLCVLHPSICKFLRWGLCHVEHRILGAQIKHRTKFQRSWFSWWWTWRTGYKASDPQFKQAFQVNVWHAGHRLLKLSQFSFSVSNTALHYCPYPSTQLL